MHRRVHNLLRPPQLGRHLGCAEAVPVRCQQGLAALEFEAGDE